MKYSKEPQPLKSKALPILHLITTHPHWNLKKTYHCVKFSSLALSFSVLRAANRSCSVICSKPIFSQFYGGSSLYEPNTARYLILKSSFDIQIRMSSTKRKPDADPTTAPTSVKKAAKAGKPVVHPARVRNLKNISLVPSAKGPVIYWMSRDQRVQDNWALLHAAEVASAQGVPVAVAFNLVTSFLGAGARQFGFMLRGLQELQPKLQALGIPFFLLQGDPADTIPSLVSQCSASLLITDFSPLRLGKDWRAQVSSRITIPFQEVDTHNVVPVWIASDKREYAARTIRPKITNKLPEYLKDIPTLPLTSSSSSSSPSFSPSVWGKDLPQPSTIDWDSLLEEVLTKGADVPEVSWCRPGEEAALQALSNFLSKARLSKYADKRNDPCIPDALSNLSPYLHFGQLSPQRAALEATKNKAIHKASVESFLEELVVRRELSDNFCYYEPRYDSLEAASDWAKDTLRLHTQDKREFIYTREQFEKGKTHDKLWNAAQLEVVHTGKMHGFMRMYWAKKILEWTATPEEALEISIWLNDKYSLDGRDPSGYVGCMWSICGIHDMGWTERPIFGKIRFMNYNGCKRKFDIDKYCARVDSLVVKGGGGKK